MEHSENHSLIILPSLSVFWETTLTSNACDNGVDLLTRWTVFFKKLKGRLWGLNIGLPSKIYYQKRLLDGKIVPL